MSVRVEPAVYRGRTLALQEAMRTHGTEWLLAFAASSALGPASRSHGAVRWLTNFADRNAWSLLALPAEGEPTLLTPSRLGADLAGRMLWFDDAEHVPATRFGPALRKLLGRPAPKRVGTIGLDEMPLGLWEQVQPVIGKAEFVDFGDIVAQGRLVKDPAELVMHRRAAEICDQMVAALPAHLRRGLAGYQVQAELERIGRLHGAEACHTWLSVAPAVDGPHAAKEQAGRVPQPGDQAVFGVMLCYDGHWGGMVRTGGLGAPRPEHRRIWDIAAETRARCLAAIRPEADLRGVWEAAEAVFAAHFTKKKDAGAVLRLRLAQGLGHGCDEAPISACLPQPFENGATYTDPAAGPVLLQPGMLLSLQPNLFVPGEAGAAIGDMVLVTETGAELLTRYPADIGMW